jgi:hypothetical protein
MALMLVPAALPSCSPDTTPKLAPPTGVLRLSGARAATHTASADDRCLIHRSGGGAESLVFFTSGAETQPPRDFVLFSLASYRGPGHYHGQLTATDSPAFSNALTWSFSRWDGYEGFVDVTVERDTGRQVFGSVQGSVFQSPQLGHSVVTAHLTGSWSCTVGDPAPALISSPTTATVALNHYWLSFRYPRGWSAATPDQVFTAGTPIAYISPQALLESCLVRPNSVTCMSPIPALRPGSLLIGWFSGFLPGPPMSAPSGASIVHTGAGSGWKTVDATGCLYQLGDELLKVVIPSQQLIITACIRGPNAGLLETEAMRVVTSASVSK